MYIIYIFRTIFLIFGAMFITTFRQFLSSFLNILYNVSKSKVGEVVEGDQKATFSIASTPRCRRGRYSFLKYI